MLYFLPLLAFKASDQTSVWTHLQFRQPTELIDIPLNVILLLTKTLYFELIEVLLSDGIKVALVTAQIQLTYTVANAFTISVLMKPLGLLYFLSLILLLCLSLLALKQWFTLLNLLKARVVDLKLLDTFLFGLSQSLFKFTLALLHLVELVNDLFFLRILNAFGILLEHLAYLFFAKLSFHTLRLLLTLHTVDQLLGLFLHELFLPFIVDGT